MILSFVLAAFCGCKRADSADAAGEDHPSDQKGGTVVVESSGERGDYKDSSSTNEVRVSSLKADDVLVAVNGRPVTVADWRRRLDFEKALFTLRHKDKSAARLEADLKSFLSMRGQQILNQLVAQYLVADYLAENKVSFAESDREAERERQVKAMHLKISYEKLASDLGPDIGYADAQFLYPFYVKLAREHFDPACKAVSDQEIDAGLERMESYYQMATASNAVTYAACSNLIARLQGERTDFAVQARLAGVQDLEEAGYWDSFEPSEIEDPELKQWAFKAPVGSVGGPFLLEDGLSIVKILEREEGTEEASLASGGVAAVELARMTFDYIEPEPEPRTREHVREALLQWKAGQVQKRMFEDFQERSPLVFPNGRDLDFDMDVILKGDNDAK